MKLVGKQLQKIIQDQFKSYEASGKRLPIAICSACRLQVYKAAKQKDLHVTYTDYSKFSQPKKITRSLSSDKCV